MSFKGKNSKSIRKKGLPNTRNTVVGLKSIKFHHETNSGEVYIDITSLVTPSGFVNPSPSELIGARIKDFAENLTLMSSARPGPLMEGLAYEIVSNNSIKLKFETYQGEIFTGVFHNNAINGTLIGDVRTPNASGELLEGQTDFNLGEAIPIKELPSQWPIQLFRGTTGRPMLRNSNNTQFAGDHSVGNYEMVDRGDGFCQVIRFNIAGDIGNEPVMWASHGALGERPNLSTLQHVDKIHGIMDTMREDLLLVTGNDITNPTKYDQGVPTNTDLKAFGDKVTVLERLYDVATKLSEYTKTKWQRKRLPAIVTVDGTISSLGFSNLVIGKKYKVKLFAQFLSNNSLNLGEIKINHNGSYIGAVLQNSPTSAGDLYQTGYTEKTFTAQATTVTFEGTGLTNVWLVGTGTDERTWSQLEEVPNHIETTDFN